MEAYIAWAVIGSAATVAILLATGARSRWQWQRQRLALDMARYERLADRLSKGDEQFVQQLLNRREWRGFRHFRVSRKVQEADGICSLFLQPHDRRPVHGYEAGQFLTLRFHSRGDPEPTVRCYSLSRAHGDGREYRITVKHVPPPPEAPEGAPWGKSSSFIHELVEEGRIIEVAPPAGQFTLDLAGGRPVVFIAGGIGVTPFLSMAEELQRTDPDREVWLFNSVRTRRGVIMADQLLEWAGRHPRFHYVNCYSRLGGNGVPLGDSEERGRISVELLKRRLPSSNYEFYVCGPPRMMSLISRELQEWGVPDSSVHMELFSSSSQQELRRSSIAGLEDASTYDIHFQGAGRTLQWNRSAGTILDLAEANGIHLPSGCKVGNCGTCATPVLDGGFRNLSRPAVPVEGGSCLVCISVPTGDMELP